MKNSTSKTNSRLYRRLVGELRQIKKCKNSGDMNELCGIEINPTDDMMIWIAQIKGPENSPFENGIYDILIRFNQDYPIKPPSVRFLDPSKIYHPNIYRDGKICVDILQGQWAPVLNVVKVLISLRSLLEDPNPNSPANRDAANNYVNDRDKYNEIVRSCLSKKSITSNSYVIKSLESLNI